MRNIKILTLFISLCIIMLAIFFYIHINIPLFSDGLVHTCIVNNINSSQKVTMTHPVNTTFFFERKIYYLPMYHLDLYILSNILNLDLDLIYLLFSFILLILIVSSLFIFLKGEKDNVKYISITLVCFIPMILWVFSHRIMEFFTYFFAVLSFILMVRNFLRPSRELFILTTFFVIFITIVKLALLPLFLFYLIMTIMTIRKNKIKFKDYKIIFIIVIIFIPAIIFFLSNSATLVYDFPLLKNNLPFFNNSNDDHLNDLSNYIDYKNKSLDSYNTSYQYKYIPFITDVLKKDRFLEIFQFLSPFAITNNANYHWFGYRFSYTMVYSFFLIILIISLLNRDINKSKYFTFPLILFICSVPFYLVSGIIQYNFYINLLFIPVITLGFIGIINMFNKNVRILFIFLLVLFLSFTFLSEVQDVLSYKHSLHHKDLRFGGINETDYLGKEILNYNVTVLGDLEGLCLYPNIQQKWDWRIFILDDPEILNQYLTEFNITYAIIPKFYLTNHNSTDWNSDFIPNDKAFYNLLNNSNKLILINETDNLYLYKRLTEK